MGQIYQILEQSSDDPWRDPVASVVNEPTGDEAIGTRYIIGSAPIELFYGIAPGTVVTKISYADSISAWKQETPYKGWILLKQDDGTYLRHDGNSWVSDSILSNDYVLIGSNFKIIDDNGTYKLFKKDAAGEFTIELERRR